jgi:quinate dehydrogenase
MQVQADTVPPRGLVTCPDPQVDHLDRHAYLFGYPIAHSMSPAFHQQIYDSLGLRWSHLPLESTDIAHFLELVRHPKCFGKAANFTPIIGLG